MSLYKDELYKLLHKRLFWVGTIISMAILFLFFWFVEVGEERSTVDGRLFKGYEAIQQDRKMTKEVEGVLTDEKAAFIVDKYGFPQVVKENYPGFRDANYLNNFVTHYLSDGYLREWNDYKIATEVYPVVQSDIGKVSAMTGQNELLFYTKGWSAFFEVLQMGMVLGSILVILGVAVVFSDESQTGMLQIIFTTEKGKHQDILAKILASFTLAIGIYIVFSAVPLLLCGLVYGMDGSSVPVGLTTGELYLDIPVSLIPTIKFAAFAMILDFIALFVLCSITLCASAHFRNSFHSVVIALSCWGIPVLIRIFFTGFAYLFLAGTPIFLIMTGVIWDISNIWFIPISFSLTILVFGVVRGYDKYRRFQV